jgi:ribosomal protein S18 acetylase RimI-like enzyme
MSLRAFQPGDLATVTALWNESWVGVPRGFAITLDDFACRVLAAPTFAETTLLLAEPPGAGFIHFGPNERWGYHLEDRAEPNHAIGVIYALCAGDDAIREELLRAAENALRAARARDITLWATWGQGTMPFYNGLTPSNEVSGQWASSPLIAWAERLGYAIRTRYRLGTLPLREGDVYPLLPEGAEALSAPFETPIIPNARRLSLRRVRGEEIGRVIYCGSEERNRSLGTRECAAFDVAVSAPYRGQGWGRALMGEMARQAYREGYTDLQLHVVAGNTPAENLYFRSLRFTPVPEGNFVTLAKQKDQTKGD